MKQSRNPVGVSTKRLQITKTIFGMYLGAMCLPAWAATQGNSVHDAVTPVPAAATPDQDAGADITPAHATSPTQQLDAIVVQGHVAGGNHPPAPYSGGQVAPGGRIGVWGEQNAANVPFSVISYTPQLIHNQQDQTVGDVLLNDASVQKAFGYGNYAEVFQIRGFELNGEDISFGGLYGVLPRQIVQTNFVSRVALFKGANAFANGVSPTGTGVGGTVNLEPKRATDEPITRFKLGYTSDSRRLESLDIGRRYGSRNQYGVRLNAQHEQGDTAIDGENANDTSIALGLDYRGERGRASLDFGYQRQHIKHGRSVVYIGDATEIPDAPDATTNYAPSYASSKMESVFGMLRGEYDLTDRWTGYAAVGANTTDEDGRYGSPTLTGNGGQATTYRLSVPYESHAFTGQAGVRGEFDTGPISHQVNIGYSGYYRRTSSAYTMSSSVPTNIYDPADIGYLPTSFQEGDLDDPNVRSRSRANGWALSDTVGFFDDRLLLTVGARYQALSINNYDYNGVQTGNTISNHRVSPVYGVVYKPTDWLSLYANHIEALQAGDAAPKDASNAGEVIGIAHAKQNEIGAKFDFGQVGGSLALYQIKKPEAYTNGNGVYGYYGQQRNRGVEMSIYGKPTERLRLLASATWMDPELTDTQGGTYDGNDAIGVPDYKLVLAGDWQLPGTRNLFANARFIRTGSQYADQANELEVDGWNRLDLGLRYEMPWGNGDQNIVWRANVENVANNDYWASAHGGYLSQGKPRTFLLSATFNFD